MRIQLNLASKKFVELGPIYLRLRILILLLAAIAVPLWLLLGTEQRKAAEAKSRLDHVNMQIRTLESQRQAFQTQMRLPQNASVLQQSQFLNQMFASKAFSWTAVMMDLENVLPGGVQVLSIDPVIARDGKVTIRLRVNGPHDKGIDLVRNLEKSRRFLSPRLARETAENNQNQRQIEPVNMAGNVNFDLLAEYNPLPEAKEKSAAEHDKAPSEGKPHKATPKTGPKAAAKTAVSPTPSARVPGKAASR